MEPTYLAPEVPKEQQPAEVTAADAPAELDISVLAEAVQEVIPAVFKRLSSEVVEFSKSSEISSMKDSEITEYMKQRILQAVEEIGKDVLTKLNMDAASFLRLVGSKQNELDVYSIGKWPGKRQMDVILRPFSRK